MAKAKENMGKIEHTMLWASREVGRKKVEATCVPCFLDNTVGSMFYIEKKSFGGTFEIRR